MTPYLLRFLICQQVFQSIEAGLPEFAMEIDPILSGLQSTRGQCAVMLSARNPAFDQPGPFQDLHVPGDRRRTYLKGLRQLPDRGRPLGQSAEDRAPRAVGKGEKHLIEIAAGLLHVTSIVN